MVPDEGKGRGAGHNWNYRFSSFLNFFSLFSVPPCLEPMLRSTKGVFMHEYLSHDYRKIPLYKDVTPEQWNDWHWQMKNDIRDVETLSKVVPLTDRAREDVEKVLAIFRMAITPYYASLIDQDNPVCPIRLQAVPRLPETFDDPSDQEDPLHEDVDSPVPGLTHRYPDRVLLLVTNICSMNCRHCTRRRLVGFEDMHMPEENIDRAIAYIAKTPVVRDVLISGGDPFVLSDDRLESIISRLRSIPHVEIIRLGTRTPVVMPMRVTDDLVNMLKNITRCTSIRTSTIRTRSRPRPARPAASSPTRVFSWAINRSCSATSTTARCS